MFIGGGTVEGHPYLNRFVDNVCCTGRPDIYFPWSLANIKKHSLGARLGRGGSCKRLLEFVFTFG